MSIIMDIREDEAIHEAERIAEFPSDPKPPEDGDPDPDEEEDDDEDEEKEEPDE